MRNPRRVVESVNQRANGYESQMPGDATMAVVSISRHLAMEKVIISSSATEIFFSCCNEERILNHAHNI